MTNSPRKTETAVNITMVDGERVWYYPYLDPQSLTLGGGRAIGEMENGERVFQYSGITREEAIFLLETRRRQSVH